jgi:hypothetical protein
LGSNAVTAPHDYLELLYGYEGTLDEARAREEAERRISDNWDRADFQRARFVEGALWQRDRLLPQHRANLERCAEIAERMDPDALKCVNGHDRCGYGPDEDCPYCERRSSIASAIRHTFPGELGITTDAPSTEEREAALSRLARSRADGLTERQRLMLDVLDRSGYLPIGLGELVDPEFCDLLNRDFISTYASMGAGRRCFITDAGRRALQGGE